MTKKSDAPAIRFKGFSDAWEQRKVQDVADRFDNLRIPVAANLRVHGTTPYYGANGIQDYVEGFTHDGEFVLVAEDGANDLKNYPVKCVNGRIWVNNHAHVLQGKAGISDNSFLAFAISQSDIESLLVGGSRAKLNAETLMSIEFKLPCLQEQYRIGEYLTQLDHLITLHQRKFEKLTNVKKSMLEKMFPQNGSSYPEIRFKGFTDPWEQRKLGELGTITTGSTPSTSIPDYYSDDGIVWVTPTDICENITFESARKLSDLGQQVGRVVPKNTILVTCIASIGKNTMLGNTGSFNQQINGLTPNEKEYDPYFLLTESALWSAKMKSSAAAGTMQIVNRTEFSELKTWLPNLIEQQAISDFFRQLDNLITLHQRELEKLQNIKKSMLEKMFV